MTLFRAGKMLVVGGALTGALVMGAGLASAAPDGPLVNTTCNFSQLDKALRAENPDLAKKLDAKLAAKPERKAKLEAFFNKPVDQRKADLQKMAAEHPERAQKMKERAAKNPQKVAEHKALAAKLAQTCKNY